MIDSGKKNKFNRIIWVSKCKKCNQDFEHVDVKVCVCLNCKKCKDCKSKILSNNLTGYCQKCQKKHMTDKQKTQISELHKSMIGDKNPSKRIEVREKISNSLKGDKHPSHYAKYRQKYSEHISKYRPNKTSKLEDEISLFLSSYKRQYRVRWYDLDFANPDKMIAVEIMGCWHHCCNKCGYKPNSKTQRLNVGNDKRKEKYLQSHGWKITYIWGCEIKENKDNLEEFILKRINNGKYINY